MTPAARNATRNSARKHRANRPAAKAPSPAAAVPEPKENEDAKTAIPRRALSGARRGVFLGSVLSFSFAGRPSRGAVMGR